MFLYCGGAIKKYLKLYVFYRFELNNDILNYTLYVRCSYYKIFRMIYYYINLTLSYEIHIYYGQQYLIFSDEC